MIGSLDMITPAACTIPLSGGIDLSVGSLLALLLSLIAQSTPRVVGDAREYALMAVNLARLESPSVSREEMAGIGTVLPGVTSEGLAMPQLQGPEGRQVFPHFWFYSLLAAPFVGAQPLLAFAVLNLLLLTAASVVLARRVPLATLALVMAGPVVWWIDKAHTEVFTVALTALDLLAEDDLFARAARNLPHVDVLPELGANVYDILRRDTLVLTKAAVERLEARLK